MFEWINEKARLGLIDAALLCYPIGDFVVGKVTKVYPASAVNQVIKFSKALAGIADLEPSAIAHQPDRPYHLSPIYQYREFMSNEPDRLPRGNQDWNFEEVWAEHQAPAIDS